MAQSNIIVKLSLKDQEVVRRGLEAVGAEGEKALRRLDTATRTPSAGLKALGAASDELRGHLDGLGQRAGVAGDALRSLGPGGLVAAAGIGALALGLGKLIDHARKTAEVFADLQDAAQRIGTTATTLSKIEDVFSGNASSADEARRALETLRAKIAEAAAGSAEAQKQFQAVGITMDFLAKHGGDVGRVLVEIARHSDLTSAEVADLTGKVGKGLIPALEALRDTGVDFNDHALDPMAKKLGDLRDRSELLDRQFDKLGAEGAVRLKEAMVEVKQALFDLEVWFLRTAESNHQFWQRLMADAARARAMSRDIATTGDSMTDDLLSGQVTEPEAYGPPAPYGPPKPAPAATPPAAPIKIAPPAPKSTSAGRSTAAREPDLGLKLGGFSTTTSEGLPLKDPAAWATSVKEASYQFKQMQAIGDSFYAGLAKIGQKTDDASAATDRFGSAWDKVSTVGTEAFRSLSDGIANVLVEGGKVEDMLSGIGEQLAKSTLSTSLQFILGEGTSALFGDAKERPGSGIGALFSGWFGDDAAEKQGAAAGALSEAAGTLSQSGGNLSLAAVDVGKTLPSIFADGLGRMFGQMGGILSGGGGRKSGGGWLDGLLSFGLNFASNLFGGALGGAYGTTGAGGLLVSGGTNSGFLLGGAAHGAAFEGGNVIPFARGGIVHRPTLFPMAQGMGLMGEAGPEAVMPLRRLPNGNLGVAGNAPQVNVVVNNHGASVKTEESRDDQGNLTIDVMVDAIEAKMAERAARTGTPLNRALGQASNPLRAR